jgi:hypothetical protein
VVAPEGGELQRAGTGRPAGTGGLAIWFLLVLLVSMAFLDGWLARNVFFWLPDTLLQFALVEGGGNRSVAERWWRCS